MGRYMFVEWNVDVSSHGIFTCSPIGQVLIILYNKDVVSHMTKLIRPKQRLSVVKGIIWIRFMGCLLNVPWDVLIPSYVTFASVRLMGRFRNVIWEYLISSQEIICTRHTGLLIIVSWDCSKSSQGMICTRHTGLLGIVLWDNLESSHGTIWELLKGLLKTSYGTVDYHCMRQFLYWE